jgi:hypothetical protein
MSALNYIRTFLTMCSLVVILHSVQGFARQNSHAAKISMQRTPAERDGQHDFDFEGDPLVVEGSLQQLDHARGLVLSVHEDRGRHRRAGEHS